MYFFKPDPLKSSLLPEISTWKFVVPKKLRLQVLKENHEEVQAGHLESKKNICKNILTLLLARVVFGGN